jgi:topoisomerase-4 subunit A
VSRQGDLFGGDGEPPVGAEETAPPGKERPRPVIHWKREEGFAPVGLPEGEDETAPPSPAADAEPVAAEAPAEAAPERKRPERTWGKKGKGAPRKRAGRAAAAEPAAPEDPPPARVAEGSDGADGGGTVSGNGSGGGWREDGHLRRLIDDNFLQYASYVIRDRAIPELEDGLKPVQRRILHSLHEADDGKFIKVANVVGHTMQYHPHGDASIGDALVNLVRKEFLIEGQGNFGNLLTGDPAAAPRYIECRLTELAREYVFHDELTRFVPSYDGRRKEPVSLPARLPLLLMMGAEGIAVGLSTRVLPHNFAELLEAQIRILDRKPYRILPDFPQGGLMDACEYEKGAGRVRLRARIEQRNDGALVIRSVPFGATTDSVIASIETAAKKKHLKIKSINDFTAEAVEIEIVLAADQDPEKMIQALYAFTQCEVSLSSRIVVIDRERPLELDAHQVLEANTRRLVKTLRRELEAERRNLLDRLHDMTLVRIFVEHRIYKRIEECKTYAAVQQEVLDGVNAHRELLRRDVTGKDVEMLLGIKIKRISRYDMDRHRKQIDDILAGIERVEKSLEDLTAHAKKFLRGVLRKYGGSWPRRTEITSFDQIEVRDLTADELTISYDLEKGYLGHDVDGDALLQCSSLDKIVVVWGDGRYRVTSPPDKLFVEQLQYCAIADRDRVCLVVYRDADGLTYIKRFTFGGSILNKDYRCVPEGGTVLFFTDDDPKKLWVRYGKAKGQRIHRQAFSLAKLPVRGVKTRGKHMTSKKIVSFDTSKPQGWSDKRAGPPGSLLDL